MWNAHFFIPKTPANIHTFRTTPGITQVFREALFNASRMPILSTQTAGYRDLESFRNTTRWTRNEGLRNVIVELKRGHSIMGE
jgi:hypothetical protein